MSAHLRAGHTSWPGLEAAQRHLWRRWRVVPLRAAAALAASLALGGCASSQSPLGYYWQSVTGHVQVLRAARPVPDWLADNNTPPALRERLQLAQRLRDFAVSDLALPNNPSYRRYADLHRRAVVWNVVAAPPDALTLKTWCFMVVGCVGYRGYYDEAEARALATQLQANEGLETAVYGVPAYSTLGWLNWLGGDPLLNTFIHYPEGELARMVFHELAHQVVFVSGDTAFNESFASAVEKLGAQQWLTQHASASARAEYAAFDARRQAVRALALRTRARLAEIYDPKSALRQQGKDFVAMKSAAMADFRAEFATLRQRQGGSDADWGGYAAWVARANNASLGAQAAYNDRVPAFEALFVREGRDWRRFYDAVKQLAALPVAERETALARLTPTSP